MINEMRIAVCGEIPTTCNMLRQEGISQIDFSADGIMQDRSPLSGESAGGGGQWVDGNIP